MEFNYPIDYSLYNVDEITIIIKFLDMIEECYTQGVDLADYKECYKEFKSIVRSKSEENNLYRDMKQRKKWKAKKQESSYRLGSCFLFKKI